MNSTTAVEQDQRMGLLNALLQTPHREIDKVWSWHQEVCERDPLFYQRLAAWYADNGEIRDHQQAFASALCLSNFPGHRDIGCALVREFPPYQLERVVNWISGVYRKVRPGKSKIEGVDARETSRMEKKEEAVTERIGLFRCPPRSLRTEVSRYLHEREAEPDWFDACVIQSRKSLKRLYALLNIKPSERAQKILFDEEPPAGSRIAALKALNRAKTPAEQAAVIREHKIPYRIASTVVTTAMTPVVMLALIESMSDQELINGIGALNRRGVLDNPDLKALVDERLKKAKKGKRVSALKADVAARAAGVSEETRKALTDVADAQIKSKGRVKMPTAILVDKSASMHQAVEVGKRIAAMVSAVCESDLFVYAFDTMPYPITPGRPLGGATLEMSDWDRAFRGINAAGGTACGAGLEAMIRQNQRASTLVLVSDGGDNTSPTFDSAYQRYAAWSGERPNVVFVCLPGDANVMEARCKAAGIEMDRWDFKGSDYYSLPQLLPMISAGNSKLELLLSIMNYPIPQRRTA